MFNVHFIFRQQTGRRIYDIWGLTKINDEVEGEMWWSEVIMLSYIVYFFQQLLIFTTCILLLWCLEGRVGYLCIWYPHSWSRHVKGKREGGERAGSTLTGLFPAKDTLCLLGDLSFSTDGIFCLPLYSWALFKNVASRNL